MKISVLLSIFIVTCKMVYAQPCAQTHVTLKSQADLQAFISSNGPCSEINGDLFVTDSILNLEGLDNIQIINGSLTISNTSDLVNISGLIGLTEVGGYIRIQNNPQLRSLDGMDNLTKVKGDFFYISNNQHIKNLNPLSQLDSINGIFQLYLLDSIETLEGLHNLKYIGNDFAIFKNDKLNSLSGIQQLNKVAQSLRIYENPQLNTVFDLPASLKIGNLLVINDNIILQTCNAEPICEIIKTTPNKCIISNNADGCNDIDQISQLCISNTGDATHQTLTIYPNPTSTYLQIKGLSKETEIKIFSSVGNMLLTDYTMEYVDIAALPRGTYIIVVEKQHYPVIKL